MIIAKGFRRGGRERRGSLFAFIPSGAQPVLMNGPADLEVRADELRRRLAGRGVSSSEPRPIHCGLQFRVGDAGVVRLYARKNGSVTVDTSQLRDPAVRLQLQGLAADAAGETAEPVLRLWPQVGADESGKGDYFGPLVAAAVRVDEFEAAGLAARGVRDSKSVPDDEVARLAATIEEECATAVEVLMPAAYNERYAALAARGKNLNDLLAELHAAAIGRLVTEGSVGVVIVDQFSAAARIDAVLAGCCPGVPVVTECGAEGRVAVAAASCVARARFLAGLAELSEKVGVPLPKGGSSPALVRSAQAVADRYGIATLELVAKVHFRTTARIRKG
jgi:ribonuclease HIII